MDFDPFEQGNLSRAFSDAPRGDRAGLLFEALQGMADGLKGISIVADLADVDADSFLGALRQTISENPANLTASRVLLWFYIRNGFFQEAKKLYATIEPHWLNYNEIFLEHMRTLIIDGSIDEARQLCVQRKAFFREAGLSSYMLQTAGGQDQGQNSAFLSNELTKHGAVAFSALFAGANSKISPLKKLEQQALNDFIHVVARADTIALVGNASVLNGSQKGSIVDRCDLVIRCNFPTITGHAPDVGIRTDAIVFNESLRPRLPELRTREAGYQLTTAIGIHPERDFNYPSEGTTTEMLGVGTIPPLVREFIADVSYSRSSTGLMALNLLVLVFRKRVRLFGFDFFSNMHRPHFFGSQVGAYLGHELQYERWFVEDFLTRHYKGYVAVE